MTEFRFGIIGCGTISHKFAEALSVIEGASVAAVSNRTFGKAEAFAQQYGVPHVYRDHRELLKDPSVDAVYLATTNTEHFAIARDALMLQV